MYHITRLQGSVVGSNGPAAGQDPDCTEADPCRDRLDGRIGMFRGWKSSGGWDDTASMWAFSTFSLDLERRIGGWLQVPVIRRHWSSLVSCPPAIEARRRRPSSLFSSSQMARRDCNDPQTTGQTKRLGETRPTLGFSRQTKLLGAFG